MVIDEHESSISLDPWSVGMGIERALIVVSRRLSVKLLIDDILSSVSFSGNEDARLASSRSNAAIWVSLSLISVKTIARSVNTGRKCPRDEIDIDITCKFPLNEFLMTVIIGTSVT